MRDPAPNETWSIAPTACREGKSNAVPLYWHRAAILLTTGHN
jgi:hypothetical protein